jgi:hypothetical protein
VTPVAPVGALVVPALLLLAWRPFPAGGPRGGNGNGDGDD